MNNQVFFSFEPATLMGSIVNFALFGAVIFLVADYLRKRKSKK